MATYRIDGFKFNRANIAGLEGRAKSACASFLASRERELCTVETHSVKCADGPFEGQTIELGEGSKTAMLSIRGWIGHYVGGAWHGTKGEAVTVIADQTNLSTKQIEVSAAKGFTAFHDLLSDLAGDFSDRVVETIIDKTDRAQQSAMTDYGFTSDTLNEFAGTYSLVRSDNPQQTRMTSRGKFVKAPKSEPTYSVHSHSGYAGNACFVDDFGDLQAFHNKREVFDAPYKLLVRRVTFTFGRASYTVAATDEAVDKLRAKIIKAKKWFSDAMLKKSGVRRVDAVAVNQEPVMTVAPASVTLAAVLATAQAMAKMVSTPAQVQATELVTCAAGESEAHCATMGSTSSATWAPTPQYVPCPPDKTGVNDGPTPAFRGTDGDTSPVAEFLGQSTPRVVEFLGDDAPPENSQFHIGQEVYFVEGLYKGNHGLVEKIYPSGQVVVAKYQNGEVTTRFKTEPKDLSTKPAPAPMPARKSKQPNGSNRKNAALLFKRVAPTPPAVESQPAPPTVTDIAPKASQVAYSKVKRNDAFTFKLDGPVFVKCSKGFRPGRGGELITADSDAFVYPLNLDPVPAGQPVAPVVKIVQVQDAPAAPQGQQVKSKSGKWSATLTTSDAGEFHLRFESGCIFAGYWFDTASARMKALQALAQAADAPDGTPPSGGLQEPTAAPVASPTPTTPVAASTPPVAISTGPRHPRNVIPADGLHVLDDAFEAWTYAKGGRFGFVMYLGKSAKPWAYYGYATEAKRDDGFKRHADEARTIALSKANRKAETKTRTEKPHGLQVGDVVRSSWGYEQTNVNHYQIVTVIGKRTVEVRKLVEHDQDTGGMTGRVAPVWGDFAGEVKRCMVDQFGGVNVLAAKYGRAHKIEPLATVHGVRCYAATGYSSYA